MAFYWVELVFGVFLIFTGIKIFFSKEEKQIDPENNKLIKILKSYLPISDELHEDKFF